MINPAKPEIKAARPRTYTTLWDMIQHIAIVQRKRDPADLLRNPMKS